MKAWTCTSHPQHGAFLQTTLDALGSKAEVTTELTVSGRPGERQFDKITAAIARGEKYTRRYGCPVCIRISEVAGKPHDGAWMRPANDIEAAQAA